MYKTHNQPPHATDSLDGRPWAGRYVFFKNMRQRISHIVFMVFGCTMVTGCLEITEVNQPSQALSGEEIIITVNYTSTGDGGSGQKFGAIQVPVGSVFIGGDTGGFGYFNRWGIIETELTDLRGTKPGYVWWASKHDNSEESGSYTATIRMRTTSTTGNYQIDYIVGNFTNPCGSECPNFEYYDESLNHPLTIIDVLPIDAQYKGIRASNHQSSEP